MCSWCWGFAPVLASIKQTFPGHPIRLVLTPFRIDTTQPMDDRLRNYVLGQWQNVHKTTGQKFDFRFAMPEKFVYNTSLVCMAIKAFKKQLVLQELDYMHALQEKFYTLNKDITQQDALIEVTKDFAIDESLFVSDLNNETLVEELKNDFLLCQQLAVTSYPTLMKKTNNDYDVLANGYTKYDDVIVGVETG